MLKSKSAILLLSFIILTGISFADQASVCLTLNQQSFSDGDSMILSARMDPAGSVYDEYFFIEMPDGLKAYLDSENGVHIDEPVSRRVVDNPIFTRLIELKLGEIPEDFYTWWIVYIPHGTIFSEENISDWVYDTETFRFASRSKSKREYVVVTNTDFVSLGTLSVIDPFSKTTIAPDVELLSSDPYISVFRDKIYVVNRYEADNIQVIDPANDYKTSFQFSTGNGSNPQTIAFANERKAYISRYSTDFNDLLIVNPMTGDETGTIDMTPYADNTDNTPRPCQMLMINEELFILIQDLDASWASFGTSKIVVIDTESDEVTGVILLEGKNPGALEFSPETGLLYVSNFGLSYPFELTGGVELVDPQNRESLGIILDDNTVNGNCGDLEILSPSKGYLVVSDADYVNSVFAFDPSNGTLLGSIYESPGAFIQSIELTDDGYLMITERYESIAGIMFVDTKTDQLVEGPLSTGSLPPFTLDTIHM